MRIAWIEAGASMNLIFWRPREPTVAQSREKRTKNGKLLTAERRWQCHASWIDQGSPTHAANVGTDERKMAREHKHAGSREMDRPVSQQPCLLSEAPRSLRQRSSVEAFIYWGEAWRHAGRQPISALKQRLTRSTESLSSAKHEVTIKRTEWVTWPWLEFQSQTGSPNGSSGNEVTPHSCQENHVKSKCFCDETQKHALHLAACSLETQNSDNEAKFCTEKQPMPGNRSMTKTNNQTGQAFFPVNQLEKVRNVHFSLWPSEIEMQIYVGPTCTCRWKQSPQLSCVNKDSLFDINVSTLAIRDFFRKHAYFREINCIKFRKFIWKAKLLL